MYIPYNSRYNYHKSVFGAVKTDQQTVFRIILPRDFRCNRAVLAVKRDGEQEYRRLDMQWDCMQGEGEEWWRVEFSAAECGLYLYHFEYFTPWGDTGIYHSGDGIGMISGFGSDWKMTVYDKSFTTPEWLKGGVFYQIFPDRFYSSGKPKKNVPKDRIIRTDFDGVPNWRKDADGKVRNNDYFGGDFKGIEEKLPYLSSLGVTCIYLNPVFEAHSNHRYDTADYERIDPLLGNKTDFKSLCRSAKKLGIRIILDGVFSHTGDDSRYFNKYGRYGEGGAYRSKESEFFDWYKFRSWPDDYVSWWGIDILPEVTEEEPGFMEYVTGENGIARKWLRLGASGWRLDVADELPDRFIEAFRESVKAEKPDALLLGEVWEDASDKVSYGKRRSYLNGAQLDSVMNYPFANAVLSFVRDGGAESFASEVMKIVEHYPKEALDVTMNHIGTHDTVRALTALAGDSCAYRDREWQSGHRLSDIQRSNACILLKMAAAIQFTLPGVPCIYYGDEAGVEGYKDPFNRTCYPWGRENAELVAWYTALGRIRREEKVFADGGFEFLSNVAGCVAYARRRSDEAVLVIANSNVHPITYYVKSEWNDSLDLMTGNRINGALAEVGAKAAVILKRM